VSRDDALIAFVTGARWFGGKGRPFRIAGVTRLGRLGDVGVIDLVELLFEDGDESASYQLPLAFYATPQEVLEPGLIGAWEDPDFGAAHVYDATHDQDVMAAWLHAFADSSAGSGLHFHHLPGHELDLVAPATLFTGEQSNSSIAFGQDSLLKIFRKVTPGLNPDVEIHAELTRSGSTHIAALYGWLECSTDTATIQLAMLQQFLPAATDGWDLAQASVSESLGSAGNEASFLAESAHLGRALAEVHADLASRFPHETFGSAQMAELSREMHARLDSAIALAADLTAYRPRLRAAYDALATLTEVRIQRIHGDLHLGQTLRTASGWKIVDFEGEPAKTLAERQLPDSPWRDVAGMLRSFDYAARAVERTTTDLSPDDAATAAARATAWTEQNQQAFLTAYAGRALTACEDALLAAYVADKAVYETVYETRNRPTWVSIPLQALAKIGAA
jgi:maltokinase